MKPLSQDLRERIIAAVDNHEGSRRAIARRFQVDVSCITRLLQLRKRTGSLQPRPHGDRRAVQARLRRLGTASTSGRGAARRDARRDAWASGPSGKHHGSLARLAETRRHPQEEDPLCRPRDRPEVREKRRRFRRKVKQIKTKRLVFVDETGVTTAMTPPTRAPREANGPSIRPRLRGIRSRWSRLWRIDGVRSRWRSPARRTKPPSRSTSTRFWCALHGETSWSSTTWPPT